MTALATRDELAARLGRTFTDGTPDAARADADLEDVSDLAVSLAGDPAWTVDGANDTIKVPNDVRKVILFAAKRLFQNPEGYKLKQAGDFQVAMDDGFSVNLFTEDERAILLKYAPGGGLGTISTTRGCGEVDTGIRLPTFDEYGNQVTDVAFVPEWELY